MRQMDHKSETVLPTAAAAVAAGDQVTATAGVAGVAGVADEVDAIQPGPFLETEHELCQ
jgi:hypothetical protein